MLLTLRPDTMPSHAGQVAFPGGRIDPVLLEREQFAAHGFAWLATYVEGLAQMLGWAKRLEPRLAAHRAGRGGRATRTLAARGGSFVVAWMGGNL